MANSSLHLTQEKLDALRSEYRPRRPCTMLKYPRPKTKPEYQYIYPWLLPDETDPHFVFCTVCECRLSAKRSDLGKHEGSMKHSENAQRKTLQSKMDTVLTPEMKWEYNDDDDGLQYNTTKTTDNEEENVDENDDDATADIETESQGDYEPERKRRVSETDSQHSGMLEYLPLQVTINEMPNVQKQPSSQMMGQYQPTVTTPQPCRITIKKVTAPLTKALTASTGAAATAAQSHKITSKATITPITVGNYVHTTAQQGAYSTKQIQSYQMQAQNPPVRDSFDLFFDSICATVKLLPPKLATEGKIRVMQLIGELELRAIGERETQSVQQACSDVAATAPAASTATTLYVHGNSSAGQQNATVASTTK